MGAREIRRNLRGLQRKRRRHHTTLRVPGAPKTPRAPNVPNAKRTVDPASSPVPNGGGPESPKEPKDSLGSFGDSGEELNTDMVEELHTETTKQTKLNKKISWNRTGQNQPRFRHAR